MIKTLIENCSGLDRKRDLVRHPGKTISLLTQYKSMLAEDVFYGLVKTLIENCSGLNSSGNLVRHPDKVISLLTQYKEWLLTQENEFYQQTIIWLFDRIERAYIHREDITKLLENHGGNIPQEMIIEKYNNTNSVDIIDLIRNYVQGTGAYRMINLPPRNDILVNVRP